MANDRIYTDVDFSFGAHPVTGDIVLAVDNRAIQQSIKNIVFTNTFERPFTSYNIAGNIRNALFENITPVFLKELEDDIKIALSNYEPRVVVESVKTERITKNNNHTISITIGYKTRSLGRSEHFSFFLERA